MGWEVGGDGGSDCEGEGGRERGREGGGEREREREREGGREGERGMEEGRGIFFPHNLEYIYSTLGSLAKISWGFSGDSLGCSTRGSTPPPHLPMATIIPPLLTTDNINFIALV